MHSGSVCFILFCSLFKKASLYTEYLLENDNVCSVLFHKRSLKLGYENKSGIIVRQEELFKTYTGIHPLDCTFSVEGGSGGVVAVIQQMRLRTYELENHNLSCTDYVQFSQGEKHILSNFNVQFNSNKKWSEKFCGVVNLEEKRRKNQGTTGPELLYENTSIGLNTYVEPSGFLDVKIHIEAQTVSHDSDENELELKIAFTSFQPCKYNMGSYKMCGGPMCIWKEYFDDSVVNCPFLECTDETLCGVESSDSKGIVTGLGTKVLLGAVAGVFTMLFVLVLFFWAFHYCGFLCTPKPPRNLTELTSVPSGGDSPRSVSCTTPLSPASAALSTGGEEKDLPPAYETLFPPSAPPR